MKKDGMETILKVNKTVIENRVIPDFGVKQGDIVSILIDKPEFEFILKDYLLGIKKNKNIEIYKTIVFADYIPNYSNLIDEIFNRNLVRNLVHKELKCNEQKVKRILDKACIGYDWKFEFLAGTPRRILSILIAFEKSNNIIYTTIGMDDKGIDLLNDIVTEEVKLRDGCAIEINSPLVNGRRKTHLTNRKIEIINTRP